MVVVDPLRPRFLIVYAKESFLFLHSDLSWTLSRYGTRWESIFRFPSWSFFSSFFESHFYDLGLTKFFFANPLEGAGERSLYLLFPLPFP